MVAQLAQGAPGAAYIADIQPFVDLCPARQPLRFRLLADGFLGQGLEQAVELHRRLFLPVQLQQAVDQLILLVIAQEAVGQAQVQGIATTVTRYSAAPARP